MKAVYKKIREMMIYKGVRGRAAHIFGVIMLVFLGLVRDLLFHNAAAVVSKSD